MDSFLSVGRVGVQQRILPNYRLPFLDSLASSNPGGVSVFAGQPLSVEAIATGQSLQIAQYAPARNRYLADPASPFFLCWQSGFIDWLEAWQPKVLVVEANSRYLSTRLAVRWMHRRNRPVLGWGLGAPPVAGFMGGGRRWERLSFLRSLDGWIAYSRRGAAEYKLLGLPEDRIFVAYNSAASRPTCPPPARPATFDPEPQILFVGRLQARKRLDQLLLACARLAPVCQPRLVIVGEGPARSDLEVFAQKYYPQAVFTGALYGQDLQDQFAAADLFVLPGTGGLAVQQAMASALPVIVAQGDGTQDDLVRPENGWLIPSDDLPALVDALEEAFADPLRLRKMGGESYRIVAEEINLENMIQVFLKAITRVFLAD